MHPTATRFAETAAERYDLDVEVHEFPEGTKTAADAASAIGCDVAQIASGLVFTADDAPVVVVTSGANRVDEARVAEQFGATSVRMANPAEVKSATGWSIGGVPPICHETAVPVLLDRTLLAHERVWAAAGTPDAVWPVDPERLVGMADARVADVTET